MLRRSSQSVSNQLTVSEIPGGGVTIQCVATEIELRFDQDEIDAFVAGIKAGEFTPEA